MSDPLPNGQDVADQVTRMRLDLADARRYTKASLVAIWHKTHPHTWTAHPPITWRREELIRGILEVKFPTWCHYHDEEKPCSTCTYPNAMGKDDCGCVVWADVSGQEFLTRHTADCKERP